MGKRGNVVEMGTKYHVNLYYRLYIRKLSFSRPTGNFFRWRGSFCIFKTEIYVKSFRLHDCIDHSMLVHRMRWRSSVLLGLSESLTGCGLLWPTERGWWLVNICCSPTADASIGVPRGSVLGPLLYLYLLYTQLSWLSLPVVASTCTSIPVYADDTQVYVTWATVRDAEAAIRRLLRKMNDLDLCRSYQGHVNHCVTL